MDVTTTYFAVGIVVLLFVIWFAQRKPADSTQAILEQWFSAFSLASEAVPAVEQLAETGQIAKDQKLTEVMKIMREFFPDLTEEQLRWAVEQAVYWMNSGIQELTEIPLPSFFRNDA